MQVYGVQCFDSGRPEGDIRRGDEDRNSEEDETYRQEETGKLILQPHMITYITYHIEK